MAKQTGAIRFIGKLANVVGYKSSLSAQANTQLVREYQSNVSNPKSYEQAKQRSKVKPAQMFYQAFETILNHAFLPSQKAAKNRLRFLKLAMSLDEIPSVPKGVSMIPGNVQYQIAEGSLGLDSLCKTKQGSTGGNLARVLFPQLAFGADITSTTTVAAFSKQAIAAIPQLQDGFELTFMAVIVDPVGATYAAHASVVLDTKDDITTIGDIFTTLGLAYDATEKCLSVKAIDETESFVACAGVIISKKTSSSWIYTNSFMGLSASAMPVNDDWRELVIASYMSASSDKTSEKILQQANNGIAANAVVVAAVANQAFTLVDADGVTTSSSIAAVGTLTTGAKRIIVGSNGQLVSYDGTSGDFVYIMKTKGGATTPLLLTDTKWAGNPTVVIGSQEMGSF